MSLTIQSPYNFNQKARSIAIFTRFQTATNNRCVDIPIFCLV
jgi:hypothetical protein